MGTRSNRLLAFLLGVVLLALGTISFGCGGTTAPDGGQPCTDDFECGIGEYCKDGICTPFGGDGNPIFCTDDSNCSSGQICEGGVCIPGSRPDGGDGDAGTDASDGGDGVVITQPDIALGGDVIIHQDAQGTTYELNFGNPSFGTAIDRQLVIRNTGDAVLSVSVVTIDADPQEEFGVQPGVPPAITLGPGESEPLIFTYLASDGLTDRAVAKLFSNDPDTGLIEVQLISEFKGEARLTVDPLTLEFGDVALGVSVSQDVTLTNQGTGNAVLRVDSVVPDAALAGAVTVNLVNPADGTTLLPPVYLNREESATAEATFLSQVRASYQGNLVVTSNDPVGATLTIPLTGRAGTPAIEVSPETVDFGYVPANTWAPDQTITIRNSGVGDLTVSAIDLAPGHSTDISLDGLPALPATVQPTGSVDFRVRYYPGEEGPDSAAVVIAHDDPDLSDVQVLVGGEGVQGNARPTAVILGNSQDTVWLSVKLNERVDLDGRTSFDNDGTIAGYQWRIVTQPAVHPCGQASSLGMSATSPTNFLVLKEAGLTTVGLTVEDDLGASSDEDLLDIQVSANPTADVRVGGNTTGYQEVDLGQALTFDGSYSSDCDGLVTEYSWSIVEYPTGRGAAPSISAGGTPATNATVVFDFPGTYRIGLIVRDDDSPSNQSLQATFTVLTRGPKAFRVTADWVDVSNQDSHVDVDLHLFRPGTAPTGDGSFNPDDTCHPEKPGMESGNPDPNWGFLGSPHYQRDSWEDGDGVVNPSSPADEINFNAPGLGTYGVYGRFRCHSSVNLGENYQCCDDMCTWGCPVCGFCMLTENYCLRRAQGTVRIYLTDFNNQETLLVERGFTFEPDRQYDFQKIGDVHWPQGTFQ